MSVLMPVEQHFLLTFNTCIIGIDTKIEVIVASPTTWEAHHSLIY